MATRVYVGGLSHRCRERDLERFFRKYGKLREISMKNGYAFVEFDDYRDADDAVYECNGKDLMGDRVSIEIAKGTPHGRDRDRWGHGSQRGGGRGDRDRSRSPYGRGGRDRDRDRDGRRPGWLDKYGPPTRTDFRCTVENLSSRVSWQDLKDYMRQAGEVTYADAHKTRKNEGTVEFGSIDDMKTAIEKLDGTELNGRKIRLVEQKRRRSSRSDSRSRSRSPRRSRSRSGGRRDRGRDRSRSRSRSNDRDNGKDRSRSKSRSKSMEKVKAKERSRSRSRDRDASRSRSRTPRSRSRSRSRGGDRDRSRSRSGSRGGDDANGRSSPAQERERMDDEDNRDD